MGRQDGHINFAKVERSTRLQKVVDLLKNADHPLSGMEIQIQAWVTNASTSIYEINQNEGYVISGAMRWKDGPASWHDGNYRYYLIAAPGWRPRWTVTREGVIVRIGEQTPIEAPAKTETAEPVTASAQPGILPNTEHTGPRLCQLKTCRQELAHDKPLNTVFCSQEHKDEYWRTIRQIGKSAMGVG